MYVVRELNRKKIGLFSDIILDLVGPYMASEAESAEMCEKDKIKKKLSKEESLEECEKNTHRLRKNTGL